MIKDKTKNNKGKKTVMITDEVDTQHLQSFINKKKNLKINIISTNSNEKNTSITISIYSINKLFSLINKKIEEHIIFKSILANINIGPRIDYNKIKDPLKIYYNQSKTPIVIDTSDLKEEEQVELSLNHHKDYYNSSHNDNHNSCNLNEDQIDESRLRELHKRNFISRHYQSMLIIWEIVYCCIILSGINILVHLFLFIVNLQLFNSFYIFYSSVIACMMLWIGSSCLWCLIINKPRTLYMEYTNLGLIITAIMIIWIWIIIPGLTVRERDYCQINSWYILLYSFGLISEVCALILNFSMDNFYREYYSLVPYHPINIS